MLLSSLQRLRNYIGGPESPLSNTTAKNRELMMWLVSISSVVEKYLNRSLHIESRTEYFDVGYNQNIFFPSAFPITSITSIKEDSTGLFSGDEDTLDTDDYYIGTGARTINLTEARDYYGQRGLQIVYTGGMAYDPVETRFTATVTGTWTADQYIYGNSSGAWGIYKSQATASGITTFTIQTLYGVFVEGETCTEHTTEGGAATANKSAVIGTLSRVSLCEAYPQIVTACEMEIRFHWKNKMNYETAGVTRDSVSFNTMPGVSMQGYDLRPETKSLLNPYRRLSVGA